MAKIVTITNPAELLMAQIEEVRTGNSQTRNEIERLRRLLKGGEKEEAKLQAELDKLLLSHKSKTTDECCHFQD
jgi:septal ring factor EnvC (AmiA/AmiB activator)